MKQKHLMNRFHLKNKIKVSENLANITKNSDINDINSETESEDEKVFDATKKTDKVKVLVI